PAAQLNVATVRRCRARYVNHSCDPNCYAVVTLPSKEDLADYERGELVDGADDADDDATGARRDDNDDAGSVADAGSDADGDVGESTPTPRPRSVAPVGGHDDPPPPPLPDPGPAALLLHADAAR